MSATTFLLILAGVIVVLVGFVVKSWSDLSNVSRPKRKDDDENSR
jgi:hypothetical protein